MIESGQIFIPMPRTYRPNYSVVVTKNGTDHTITPNVILGTFKRNIFRIGIGTFNIKMSDTNGTWMAMFSGGETITFYADLGTGTTKQFVGRIDKCEKGLEDSLGKTLTLTGRQNCWPMTETFPVKTYLEKTRSEIISDLVSSYLTNIEADGQTITFTTTNVEETTDTYSITWNGSKSLIECLKDLCDISSSDGYVDSDLDIHLFTENSKMNKLDALAEKVKGRRLLSLKNYGIDTLYERTKVRVQGEDDEGQEIIYTAGSGVRGVKVIVNKSLKTYEEVQAYAEATLSAMSAQVPEAVGVGYGMPYLNPGENFMLFAPRMEIAKALKAISIEHAVGKRIGTWLTSVTIEREEQSVANIIKKQAEIQSNTMQTSNENDLDYSYNFSFDDSSQISDIGDGAVTGGYLYAPTGSATVITNVRDTGTNVSKMQLKYIGENNGGTSVYVQVDGNDNHWEEISNKEYTDSPEYTGSSLRIKIVFTSADAKIQSLALLYSVA